ncbi:MAG: MerR family transcriptional regulator [Actinomycetota bacterium]|nr:MerR family transcriptional regulator [Actinomycetota bacterium]
MPSHLSWPVGAVADRVGLAPSTLRSWDRRYGIGPSDRTSGNHRRYSHVDVLRVLAMARLTASGIPAQAAALATLALADDDLLREGERQPGQPGAHGVVGVPSDGAYATTAPEAEPLSATVRAIVSAARVLDAATLAHLFRQALREPDITLAWDAVLAPALQVIGSLWEQGQLGIDSEHLASEVLGSELRAVTRAAGMRVATSPILLATADDEQHHLPVLALEAELARHGVSCTFLGPRMPSEAISRAVERTGTDRVFLWASIPRGRNAPVVTVPPGSPPVRVVLGGPGWPQELPECPSPVEVVRSWSFRGALDALMS